MIYIPLFATAPPQTTNEIVADSLRNPRIEVMVPAPDSMTYASERTISWNDALEVSKDSVDEKSHSVYFNLGTAQAGVTTNGDIKDRVVVCSSYKDKVRYRGTYEGFQNKCSFLDGLFLKNEISLPGIGSENYAPISVMKFCENNGKFSLYDTEFGVVNKSVPKMLSGNGRIYATTDLKDITLFFDYWKEIADGIVFDVTGQGIFGSGKPSLYIEGELQKQFGSGTYLFIRGEVDNCGLENKVVFGIGYSPKM